MAPGTELLTEIGHLRKEVAGHKQAIRKNKDALHLKASRLETLEAECRRRGIAVILVHSHHKPGAEEGDRSSWPPPHPHPF